MTQRIGNAWPDSKKRRRQLAEYWWANGLPKAEDIDPQNMSAILYRHPTSSEKPGILLQWYEGQKPRSMPMWFFETDLRLLRQDMQRGWKVWVRSPKQKLTLLGRHDTYQDIYDRVGAALPR